MDDYKAARTYKSSSDAKEEKHEILDSYGNEPWWDCDDERSRCSKLVAMAKSIEQNSQLRSQANLRHARVYENINLETFQPRDYAQSLVQQAALSYGNITLNVTAACIDTLSAKISKNKPRPEFLTSGGSWDKQQKARRLDKFMRGLFYETDVYEKAKEVFVDSGVLGTGALHIFLGEDGRIACERVFPDELLVDDLDGHYRNPTQLIRRKLVQKEVLIAQFPDKAEMIAGAHTLPRQTVNGSTANMLEVWEAWHLPQKGGDGKHMITLNEGELFCEEWKCDSFPFVFLRYKDRTAGFWGKGVVEHLMGIQLELNRLMRSVSEQLRRKGRGRIFVAMGSKVNPDHLTNGIGDVVWYNGQPPTVDSSNAVSQEEFMQIDRLYQKAFQEVGISELSAAAKKPSGLDAAVALREYSDIESERFALIHQRWERFFMEFAETCLELLDDQWGAESYKVKLPSKRFVIEMDWKDIELERDAYVMQMFPVSSLPQTPAARYQKVKEMLADGFIDKVVAQRLLEFPDIEAETNLGNAALDDVDATISAILDDVEPKFYAPEQYQNLELLIQRGTAAYLYARHHGAEESRLELLRQLVDSATAMLNPPAPPMPPGAPMGPDAMGAPPGGLPPGMPPPPGAAPGGPININVPPSNPLQPAVPPLIGR